MFELAVVFVVVGIVGFVVGAFALGHGIGFIAGARFERARNSSKRGGSA